MKKKMHGIITFKMKKYSYFGLLPIHGLLPFLSPVMPSAAKICRL